MLDRDAMGRVVREAWVRWALTQPNPKPSWLVPYDELSEADKEADRQIAESVFHRLNARRHELIELGLRSDRRMTETEAAELSALQIGVFDVIDAMHPRPEPSPPD